MKSILLISVLFVLTLASDQNQHKKSRFSAQMVRLNHVGSPRPSSSSSTSNSDSSSSESIQQSQNILKTKLYNPQKCKLVPPPSSDELNQFQLWIQEYNRTYSTSEEHICRTIYVIQSIREIYAHNKLYDEGKIKFRRRLNGLSDLTTEERNYRLLVTNKGARNFDIDDLPNLPDARESVDYRHEDLVTPAGLQIRCNSCYAWAGAAVLEGQLRKCLISKQPVSVQSMIDCPTESNWHCKSGVPYSVFRWSMKNGILPAAKYPYEDQDEPCKFSNKDVLAYVDTPYEYDFYNIDKGDEYMKKLVSHIGPIASGMCSSKTFEDYASGVYDVDDCCSDPNHAIAIIGYGTDPRDGDYWLIKNSWGPTWGENGFGKIARGKNMCEFETEVYFAQLRDKNGKVCRILP